MPQPFDRLLTATTTLDTPFALVDAPALWANADDLVRRAGGVKVRVASKSVRVRSILEQTLARDGFAGIMSYSLAESNWLVDQGIDDILLAYPTTSRQALKDLVADERRRAAITVMVDSVESLDHIDSLIGPNHPEIRVCIDVDCSLKLGPIHLGVRRSPVHTPRQARKLAAAIEQRPGFDLVGVMFYDAQIAGLPDSSKAVRLVKKRSVAELLARRGKVVAAVAEHAALEIVNAGGHRQPRGHRRRPRHHRAHRRLRAVLAGAVRRLRRFRVTPRRILRALRGPQAATRHRDPVRRRIHRVGTDQQEPPTAADLARGSHRSRHRGRRRGAEPAQGQGRPPAVDRRPRRDAVRQGR
ncbi:alanine racemase [Aeromicrobium sp. UC242_57]|uniref:alanine racemase n=1 Tax=Aeromicrobium sp. UC242_57 TaxID=3374624 RepID=UPI003795DD50